MADRFKIGDVVRISDDGIAEIAKNSIQPFPKESPYALRGTIARVVKDRDSYDLKWIEDKNEKQDHDAAYNSGNGYIWNHVGWVGWELELDEGFEVRHHTLFLVLI